MKGSQPVEYNVETAKEIKFREVHSIIRRIAEFALTFPRTTMAAVNKAKVTITAAVPIDSR